MTHYVYSTLTANQLYTSWKQGANDMPNIEKQVLIKGGAGLANKNFITPLGVATSVTDNELDCLNENTEFLLHKKNGFIVVQKKKVDVEVAVSDMQTRDKSSPIVPQDFDAKDKVLPQDY